MLNDKLVSDIDRAMGLGHELAVVPVQEIGDFGTYLRKRKDRILDVLGNPDDEYRYLSSKKDARSGYTTFDPSSEYVTRGTGDPKYLFDLIILHKTIISLGYKVGDPVPPALRFFVELEPDTVRIIIAKYNPHDFPKAEIRKMGARDWRRQSGALRGPDIF